MAHRNSKQAVRRRATFTGESHRRAAAALNEQPRTAQLIPTASRAQSQLELELLGKVGRGFVADTAGWRPGEEPFGISWMTPRPEQLDIGVRLRYLPGLLRAVLPRCTDDAGYEPHGICGLRFRLTRNTVVLSRLDLPGSIRICGITATQWWQGLNAMLAELDYDGIPRGESIWIGNPDRLHKDEEDFARRHAPGYCGTSRALHGELASAASNLLRHHRVFSQEPFTNGLDVWMNPRVVEVEWHNGPSHTQIIDQLTAPYSGMAAVLDDDPCTECLTDSCRYSVYLRTTDGNHINIRRNKLKYADDHEREVQDSLRRRLTFLRQSANTTSIKAPAVRRHEHPEEPASILQAISLADRLDNSARLLGKPDSQPHTAVGLARAWNAFTTTALFSVVLEQHGVPYRDNYTTALHFARSAAEAIRFAIGDELIGSRGRTADTTMTCEQELDEFLFHAQMEMQTTTPLGIDTLAGHVVSLMAQLQDVLERIANDETALPIYRALALRARQDAWEIYAHYGGDSGGW